MTTGRVESWAGNMLDIGPLYPFVGTEFVLFLLGIAFWLGWHVLQFRIESKEFVDDKARASSHVELGKALDRYDS